MVINVERMRRQVVRNGEAPAERRDAAARASGYHCALCRDKPDHLAAAFHRFHERLMAPLPGRDKASALTDPVGPSESGG